MSNILQTIFFDYYEHIQYELHPRQTVMENVSKMIHCGDPSYGGAMFACPDCGELKFSPLSINNDASLYSTLGLIGIYGYEKEYNSFEDFALAVEEYINYYNNERIQAKTKWMPPVKYRETSICA